MPRPSFAEIADGLYADLFAYTTIKVVRTNDWRLSLLKRVFNAGVFIYILFFLVFYHGYLYKEVPSVSVTTSVSDASYTAALRNLSVVHASTGGYPPSYCALTNVTTLVNGTNVTRVGTATDYVWGPGRAYVNNECARYFLALEVAQPVYLGQWLYTYWQQSDFTRACASSAYTGAAAAAGAGNPSDVPSCGSSSLVANQSVLPVGVEATTLTFVGTYTTSWGRTVTSMPTTISAVAASFPPGAALPPQLSFSAGQPVSFTFAQLLELANIDLDAPNVLSDGGAGPPWPTYRVTGVELVVTLSYYNYVTTLDPPDPFNFGDYLVATVAPASKGTFRSPGTLLWYLGGQGPTAAPSSATPFAAASAPETAFMARTPNGVLVTFSPGGSIGQASFTAFLTTILSAIVLFGAATTLVDVSAAFLIEGFREQKFEDELEMRIRTMLRTQLGDTPTRAEVDAYEAAAAGEQKRADGLVGRARRRAARLRARARRLITGDDRAAVAKEVGHTAGAAAAARAEGAAAGAAADSGALSAIPSGPIPPVRDEYRPVARPPGLRDAPLGGTTSSLVPRVLRLVIAGEAYHSSGFSAQGFLEHCRVVRLQWHRTRDGVTWHPLVGATSPSFYATADDLGHCLAVDATPVADDGFEGRAVRAVTGALGTRPSQADAVLRLASAARGGPAGGAWVDVKDGVWVAGVRATLRLSRTRIVPRTKRSVEMGGLPVEGVLVALPRTEPCLLTLTGVDGLSFEVSMRSPEERDTLALAIRELAQPRLMLLNDPTLWPSVAAPPQGRATGGDGEDDDNSDDDG